METKLIWGPTYLVSHAIQSLGKGTEVFGHLSRITPFGYALTGLLNLCQGPGQLLVNVLLLCSSSFANLLSRNLESMIVETREMTMIN